MSSATLTRPRGLLMTAPLLLLLCLVTLVPAVARADTPQCHNCMDGMPMDGCPLPQRCGFAPILCVDCMDGMAMPQCPNAAWCAGVSCSAAQGVQCLDGRPTSTCPDPGTCGFQPISCVGCVPGQFRNACPNPEWCANNQTTFPCIDCMMGMTKSGCPNATECSGAGPMPAPWHPPCPPCIHGGEEGARELNAAFQADERRHNSKRARQHAAPVVGLQGGNRGLTGVHVHSQQPVEPTFKYKTNAELDEEEENERTVQRMLAQQVGSAVAATSSRKRSRSRSRGRSRSRSRSRGRDRARSRSRSRDRA